MILGARSIRPALIRAGALALPLVFAGVFHANVIAPALEATRDATAQIEVQRDLTRRYAAIAARAPALEAELVIRETEQKASPRLLSGGTADVALAGLQERIASAVRAAGGSMRSASGSIDAASEGLERITANVQFGADIAALSEILHVLESGEPILFVDRITIGGQVRPEGGALQARRVLDVSIGLSGYRLARPEEVPS